MGEATFLTLSSPGESLFKEKGSKFIGYAHHAASVEAAITFVKGIKVAHPKATHVCFAYRLGPNGEVFKTSDGGEPMHSAGVPILNAIKGYNLSETVVAVVRYYGGVMLGLPGLVQAYRQCAAWALENATTITSTPTVEIIADVAYSALDKVKHIISTFPSASISLQAYDTLLPRLHISCPKESQEELQIALSQYIGVSLQKSRKP